MSVGQEPDETVEEPAFKVPFSDADRELLVGRAPQYLDLLELAGGLCGDAVPGGAMGSREVLAALKAVEVARRLVESASTELLAAYKRMGDSAAHGFRTTEALLAGEFRITPAEARRRVKLSELLTGRISESGEPLQPIRPAIADNFADGRISADEARALCDAVDALPPTAAQLYADRVEKTLVELAPTVQLKDFPKLCNRIIQHIDPDGALPAFEPEPRKYNVTLAQQRNGDWRLRGLLSGQTGTTLHALLYGRMKDADVPVTVRPQRTCNTPPTTEKPTDDAPGTAFAAVRDATTGDHDGAGDSAGAGRADMPGRSAETDRTGGAGSTVGSDSADSTSQAPPPESGVPPADDEEYSVTSAVGADEIPQVPLETMWESTRVRVHADARVEIDGVLWTLDEDEPQFVLSESGWPVGLPDRLLRSVHELLDQARKPGENVAETVLWTKVLGRRPVEADGGESQTIGNLFSPKWPWEESPPGGSTAGEPVEPEPPDWGSREDARPQSASRSDAPPGATVPPVWPAADADLDSTTGNGAGPGTGSTTGDGAAPGWEQDYSPPPTGGLRPSGVFADGSRSDVHVDVREEIAPGEARHERFGFLLRSVARERVLHGADHALVISARPDDLTKPTSLLTTHTGSQVTLSSTEQWSNAAQTFLHLVDEGGRTVQIRSQGRFATRSQMAVLAARDQGCTFPDCDAPAEWCEAHHIVAWARGGETAVDNLTLLCPFHHRWFEKSGWDGTFLNGLPAWIPPAHIDRKQRALFHSRFRVALLNLPPELPLTAG